MGHYPNLLVANCLFWFIQYAEECFHNNKVKTFTRLVTAVKQRLKKTIPRNAIDR